MTINICIMCMGVCVCARCVYVCACAWVILQNPSLVSTSLQVFFNLGQLTPTLQTVLHGFRTALQHEGQIALDPATLVQGLDGKMGGVVHVAEMKLAGIAEEGGVYLVAGFVK